MNTELTNSINAADEKAQYDEYAKRLLSQKIILSHILVKTVEEFRGMEAKEVVKYIEGEPYIGVVPTEPGLTNMAGEKSTKADNKENTKERIVGLNTENAEMQEGLIKFDIVFYVRMKNGLTQIIVNVEAQKDKPSSYKILNRRIFYVSRLISSQKERDFVGMKYDDIKSVVSIWICMNMEANCMSHYHLTKEELLEPYDWGGNMELINIVLLGIKGELPKHDEKYELHRLLGTLLSDELKAHEKLKIMEKEYKIPINDNVREEVSTMCNLSQGIEEKGYNSGYDKAVTTMIINMHKEGYEAEEIGKVAKLSKEQVEKIIEQSQALLV